MKLNSLSAHPVSQLVGTPFSSKFNQLHPLDSYKGSGDLC